MNRSIFLLLIFFLVCMIVGCSDEKSTIEEKTDYLSIQTDIDTRAVKTTFGEGDEIGLFIKSTSEPTSSWYNQVTGICKAVYDNKSWTISPAVVLSNDQAYVFAYYPFSMQSINSESIPVNTNQQIDYLYAGTSNVASRTNSVLKLNMQHVQTNFRFNIVSMDYTGEGNLESIEIRNKEGKEIFYTTGTFSAATGVITGIKDGHEPYIIPSINRGIVTTGWSADLPSAMVIPFMSESKGDVEFVFIIDKKQYIVECPVRNGGFTKGKQYTFTLRLSDLDLTLNKEEVTVESWADNTVEVDDLVTRGSITYSVMVSSENQVIYLPTLDISKGKLNYGDGQTGIYSSNLEHTYNAIGSYQVRISSSEKITRVSFPDISSISEIDLSTMGE